MPLNAQPTGGLPDRLRTILSHSDTVLFVGSGASVWSGLPTWRGLLEHLADYLQAQGLSPDLVRRELSSGDLLQAASYGFYNLTIPQRCAFLRQECAPPSAAPSPLHRRLATLGPTCFITTNYDKLLEEALREALPATRFRLVTTVNLVETATVIQSRAVGFVFKPHGDIDNCDSVVLTREDYRELHSAKPHVLEALKTLLASRPVVFVGFGLRDPDFLMVKDALAAVYRGAAQDQFALMADVDADELPYWRETYGIHLVPYQTTPGPNPHAALMALLDEMAPSPHITAPNQESAGSGVTLAMLRHAQRVKTLAPSGSTADIPMRATPTTRELSSRAERDLLGFYRQDVVTALTETTGRLVLTGPPGAGKSHAMRSAASRIATSLLERSIQIGRLPDDSKLPTYLDLKRYTGDLWGMAAAATSVGVPFEGLVEAGRVMFFIDGVNEVASELMDSNRLRGDVSDFLRRTPACPVVFATRFSDEFQSLGLTEVQLDEISREFVTERLANFGLRPESASAEMIALLQRPLFFHQFAGSGVPAGVNTPHDAYASMVEELNYLARERFGPGLDFMSLFGRLAYEQVDTRQQLMPAVEVLGQLEGQLGDSHDPVEVLDWLLGRGTLVPGADDRVSFFHHSITEYLAAYHLAELYSLDRRVLRRCLARRQWDHAVLLALGFLSEELSEHLFTEVLETDIPLGLRALSFLEHGVERWLDRALRHLIAQSELPMEVEIPIQVALERLPVLAGHTSLLWQLSERDGSIGGAALGKLLELEGESITRRAIDIIFARPEDYNYCSRVGERLKRVATRDDADYLFERLVTWPVASGAADQFEQTGELEELTGLTTVAADVLSSAAPETILERVRSPASSHLVVTDVLVNWLMNTASRLALRATAELIARASPPAATALYFQLAFHTVEPADLVVLEPRSVGPTLARWLYGSHAGWAVGSLRHLCSASTRWWEWVREEARSTDAGVYQALLYYAVQDVTEYFAALETTTAGTTDWSREPVGGLQHCDAVSWVGHELLLIQLLTLRDERIAGPLLEPLVASAFESASELECELGDLQWWLDWLIAQDPKGIFADRLGQFLAVAGTTTTRDGFILCFRRGGEEQRAALADFVLPHVAGVELSDFDVTEQSWLIDDLHRPRWVHSVGVLGTIATEEFMEARILPLLERKAEPEGNGTMFRSNVLQLAVTAGQAHGRRYVTAEGKLVD